MELPKLLEQRKTVNSAKPQLKAIEGDKELYAAGWSWDCTAFAQLVTEWLMFDVSRFEQVAYLKDFHYTDMGAFNVHAVPWSVYLAITDPNAKVPEDRKNAFVMFAKNTMANFLKDGGAFFSLEQSAELKIELTKLFKHEAGAVDVISNETAAKDLVNGVKALLSAEHDGTGYFIAIDPNGTPIPADKIPTTGWPNLNLPSPYREDGTEDPLAWDAHFGHTENAVEARSVAAAFAEFKDEWGNAGNDFQEFRRLFIAKFTVAGTFVTDCGYTGVLTNANNLLEFYHAMYYIGNGPVGAVYTDELIDAGWVQNSNSGILDLHKLAGEAYVDLPLHDGGGFPTSAKDELVKVERRPSMYEFNGFRIGPSSSRPGYSGPASDAEIANHRILEGGLKRGELSTIVGGSVSPQPRHHDDYKGDKLIISLESDLSVQEPDSTFLTVGTNVEINGDVNVSGEIKVDSGRFENRHQDSGVIQDEGLDAMIDPGIPLKARVTLAAHLAMKGVSVRDAKQEPNPNEWMTVDSFSAVDETTARFKSYSSGPNKARQKRIDDQYMKQRTNTVTRNRTASRNAKQARKRQRK